VSKEVMKMTPLKLDISCGDRKVSLSVPVYQPSLRRTQMLEALDGLVDEAKYMLRAQRGRKQAVTA
jgi:hypothetical protein